MAEVRLTKREMQIGQMLAAGKKPKQIALLLSMSDKTVSVHKSNLMRKADVHNREQLVEFMRQFVSLPEGAQDIAGPVKKASQFNVEVIKTLPRVALQFLSAVAKTPQDEPLKYGEMNLRLEFGNAVVPLPAWVVPHIQNYVTDAIGTRTDRELRLCGLFTQMMYGDELPPQKNISELDQLILEYALPR